MRPRLIDAPSATIKMLRDATDAQKSMWRAEAAVERDVFKRGDFSEGVPDMFACGYVQLLEEMSGLTAEEIEAVLRAVIEAEEEEANPAVAMAKAINDANAEARALMHGDPRIFKAVIVKSLDGDPEAEDIVDRCRTLWERGEKCFDERMGRLTTKSERAAWMEKRSLVNAAVTTAMTTLLTSRSVRAN